LVDDAMLAADKETIENQKSKIANSAKDFRSSGQYYYAMPDPDRVWRERGLRSAVLAGDERAWQCWYDQSYAELYRYVCWRCAGRRDLADEMVQETWLTAVRRIRTFDPEQASFAAWLRGIAANVIRNHLRSQRRAKPTVPLAGNEMKPEISGDQDLDEQNRIAEALAGLSERHEAVLRAKYLGQRSVAEIAADWGETPKAIESLLTRAREAFRQAYC
jgi:RNA polymerase sigma-70 factor (ECF subfamily)